MQEPAPAVRVTLCGCRLSEQKLDILVSIPYNHSVMKKKELLITEEEKRFHRMNDVIMEIAKTYMKWHDQEHKFGIDENLCRAEIHTVQAIGNSEGLNVTQLARLLNVTKPTVSERVNKLSRIGLVEKRTSGTSNKEIVLSLTGKGWLAYRHHERKHRKLYGLFEKNFGDKAGLFLDSFEDNLGSFSRFLCWVKKEKDFK